MRKSTWQFPPLSAIQLTLLVLTLQWALAPSLYAQNCRLSLPKTVLMGDTAFFSVSCLPDLTPSMRDSIRWEFGDSDSLIWGSKDVFHVYTSSATNVVFARFPKSSGILPLNGVVEVVETHHPFKAPKTTSIIYVTNSQSIWTVNPDNASVTRIDTKNWTTKIHKVCQKPRTLTQVNFDKEIWVTCEESATVAVVDEGTGQIIKSIQLPRGSSPYGILAHPQRSDVWVSLQGTGKLVLIDKDQKRILEEIPAGPWPRAMAMSHEGHTLWVTRYISPRENGEIMSLDLKTKGLSNVILKAETDATLESAVNGRGVPNAIDAIMVTQSGKDVITVGKKDNVFRGMLRDGKKLGFEHTVRSFMAVINSQTRQERLSERLDIDNRSLPKALETTLDGRYIFVATAGTNHISILNTSRQPVGAILRESGLRVEPGEEKAKLLSPIGMVTDDKDSLLFVHYYTTRDIGVYQINDLRTNPAPIVSRRIVTVPPESESLSSTELMGLQVFYNAQDKRMASEGYLSCAVCHLDGGSDQRVYDFSDRGEGLRKTISLLGRGGMKHGPLHYSANFDEMQDFENDMRLNFGGEGFLSREQWERTKSTLGVDKKSGLSPELDALAEYVTSLDKYPKSPYKGQDGEFTEKAIRGRSVFLSEQTRCIQCHQGPNLTKSSLPITPVSLENVGTQTDSSGGRMGGPLLGLDVQTLHGLWSNAPYLHDGSANTLEEVLTTKNRGDRHGKTSHLKKEEIEDLVAYLLQLDGDSIENGTAIRSQAKALAPNHKMSRNKLKFDTFQPYFCLEAEANSKCRTPTGKSF